MSVECVAKSFWWDAGRPADAAVEPLQAVVFDLDGAVADLTGAAVLGRDVTPRPGLDDLVNSLFFGGVPVAVISRGARSWVAPLVRQLIGDGIVETVVTPDDLSGSGAEPDLHGQVLWELGIGPEAALAVAGTRRGFRAARSAKLTTLVVTTDQSAGADFTGAVDVRAGYDGLLVAGCELMHRRAQLTR